MAVVAPPVCCQPDRVAGSASGSLDWGSHVPGAGGGQDGGQGWQDRGHVRGTEGGLALICDSCLKKE